MVRPTSPPGNISPDFWTAGTCQEMATVRILLVDDFAPFRFYVRRILEQYPEGDVIGEAADGVAALQLIAELEPDLILLDISLPRLNGLEVALQVGAMAPRSKILFLSSHCSQELGRLCPPARWVMLLNGMPIASCCERLRRS